MHRRSDRLGIIGCKLKQVSIGAPVTGGPNIGVLTAELASPSGGAWLPIDPKRARRLCAAVERAQANQGVLEREAPTFII
jgi:hypothetical protein